MKSSYCLSMWVIGIDPLQLAQKTKPKAKATREAKKVGTKVAASDVGLGAGASVAAAAFCTEEMAIKTTINATKNFNFIASISLKCCVRKKKKRLLFFFQLLERDRTTIIPPWKWVFLKQRGQLVLFINQSERERERERMLGVTMYRVAVSLLLYSCQALWGPHILLSSLSTVLAFLCGSLFISPLFIYFLSFF